MLPCTLNDAHAPPPQETYLFRAACSELRTELRNTRATASEKQRSERTALQHEVDILSQRVTQDSAALKDELRGMFDDRKMAVRTDRRVAENEIQTLNYRIALRLTSEMRSEVEGLRWVLTRRTVLALACIVVMTLATLRYAKYAERKQEIERRKMEALGRAIEGEAGGARAVEGAMAEIVRDADNPKLTSLLSSPLG